MPITSESRFTKVTKHHDALKGSMKKRLGQHGAYLRIPKMGWRCAEIDGRRVACCVTSPDYGCLCPWAGYNIYSLGSGESGLLQNRLEY
jgi:hypothetical protein